MAATDTRATWSLEVHDGHLIADIGGTRALIDTGSPVSFGRGGPLAIPGRKHTLKPALGSITADQIGGFIGTPVDCLVGGDIFHGRVLTLDFRGMEMIVEPRGFSDGGVRVPMRTFLNVPVVPFEMRGGVYQAFLDTGAKVSFFDPVLFAGLEPVGVLDDFFPTMGPFRTDLYRVTLSFGGVAFNLTAGKLPEQIRTAVSASGVPNILGTDVMRQLGRITFDYRNREIVL
jgi:hypothetical protein